MRAQFQGPKERREGAPIQHDDVGRGDGSSLTARLATFVLIGAVLYIGRSVLVPLAIAILLSFLLSPFVNRLQRLRLPRVPAVILTSAVAFFVLGTVALAVGAQVTQLAAELPEYQANLIAKLRGVADAAPSGGAVDRFLEMIHTLRAEVDDTTGSTQLENPDVPVVQIRERAPSSFDVFMGVTAPLLGPIGTAGIVLVLVILMLLEREALRNRLIRLLGPNLNVTTEALDEAGSRVSRYLFMQLVVNVVYGLPFGIGLYLLGVPNAILWAALAVVLRFIPYLGPLLSAVFPLLLAAAVDPTWTTLLLALGLILTLELISNNFIEPWLYGASTQISPVAIIVAATFWTALWGPIGLLLATPLTVCLAVAGRYFPHLAFLDVLLSSAPALSLPERFYQRLLAADVGENVAIAKKHLQTHSLIELYDDVVLPALCIAAADHARGAFSSERRAAVMRTALEFVDEFAEQESTDEALNAEARDEGRPSVLCAAGRSGLELAVAEILGQLLEREQITARVVSFDALDPAHVKGLEVESYDAFCLSYLGDADAAHAQQLARRLSRKTRNQPILIGLWRMTDEQRQRVERLPEQASLVGSLQQMVAAVQASTNANELGYVPALMPANEAARLKDLEHLGALYASDARLERFTQKLASGFQVPVSLLNLVDEDSQHFKGPVGLPEPLAKAGQSSRATSMCGHVVSSNELLIVEDALKDPRFAKNPFLIENGIRFYAGAPLRSSRGHAIGSLCVLDAVPRRVTEEERKLLLRVAEEAMGELETLAPCSLPTGPDPLKSGAIRR